MQATNFYTLTVLKLFDLFEHMLLLCQIIGEIYQRASGELVIAASAEIDEGAAIRDAAPDAVSPALAVGGQAATKVQGLRFKTSLERKD